MAVGVIVQGGGTEPEQVYEPPATIGTDVGYGDGDAFGSEQILYGPLGLLPHTGPDDGPGVVKFFEPVTVMLCPAHIAHELSEVPNRDTTVSAATSRAPVVVYDHMRAPFAGTLTTCVEETLNCPWSGSGLLVAVALALYQYE